MWVPCVRVPGVQAHQGPGPAQVRSQLRMHVEQQGLPRPCCAVGSALPGFPQSSSKLLLCSFASCGLGQSPARRGLRQSLRSTSSLDGMKDVGRAPGALPPQLAGGSFASPGPPSNRRRPASWPPPPLGVVGALRSAAGTPRQFSGLALKGGPESFLVTLCLSCPSRWADRASPVLSSFVVAAVLRSRP